MNKKTEALKMAIEHIEHNGATTERKMVLQACKEALEQPVQNVVTVPTMIGSIQYEQPAQEPVYTNTNHGFVMKDRNFYNKGNGYIWDENFDYDASLYVSGDFAEGEKDKYTQMIVDALNTHPAPSWQGLSDDEIEEIVGEPIKVMYSGDYETYRAIEQALKEKNEK